MTVDCDGDKDVRELNHGLRQGNKTVIDGVVSKEKNLDEDNGLKVHGIAENVKHGHSGAHQAPPPLQTSHHHHHHQQQSQGTMVCWEKFLHLRSLKVLLVENDDSTRHVLTALLRNCSYEGW
uniref:Response regulatory domain-containing protein n=1 Tax=Rhizophora mucronata TaxID=61149 RepID=A0A2P2LFQ7_RHIMU